MYMYGGVSLTMHIHTSLSMYTGVVHRGESQNLHRCESVWA